MLCKVVIFSSCQKEKVCNVDNPKKDLPWLKDIIDETPKGAPPGVKIYQCIHKGDIVFLLDVCTRECSDFQYVIVNCEGEQLCASALMNCEEYADIKRKKLIWKN